MTCEEIEIIIGDDIPFEQLISLYESVGWRAYTHASRRADLKRAITNSSYVVSAWHQRMLVGLARGLSDDVSIFYLQDIVVHPEFQRKGIGKRLIQNCLERYKHVKSRVLLTDDTEQQLRFYESMGFINIRNLTKFTLNAFVQTEGVE